MKRVGVTSRNSYSFCLIKFPSAVHITRSRFYESWVVYNQKGEHDTFYIHESLMNRLYDFLSIKNKGEVNLSLSSYIVLVSGFLNTRHTERHFLIDVYHREPS